MGDDGPGIPLELRCRLFEPFATSKPRGRGTGLGLSMVRDIIRQHHGDIRLESSENRGATFTILLPAAEAEEPRPLPIVAESSRVVLLVDDEPLLQDFCTHVLAERGIRVLPAGNCQEALNLGSKHATTVTLAIIDMTLPDGDGLEVHDKLRSIGVRCPVLFISGYHDFHSLQANLPGEPLHLLGKPFTAHEFTAAVDAALASNPAPAAILQGHSGNAVTT